MSTSFDATLALELKRSPALIAALCVMHVGALIVIVVVPAAATTRWVLALFVAAGAAHALWHHVRLGVAARCGPTWLRPRIVEAIEWDSAGNWSVRYAGSTQWHACELREYWLHPWLVILRLRPEADRRTLNVLIVADAVAPDGFRRLRARLRLQTAAA